MIKIDNSYNKNRVRLQEVKKELYDLTTEKKQLETYLNAYKRRFEE